MLMTKHWSKKNQFQDMVKVELSAGKGGQTYESASLTKSLATFLKKKIVHFKFQTCRQALLVTATYLTCC